MRGAAQSGRRWGPVLMHWLRTRGHLALAVLAAVVVVLGTVGFNLEAQAQRTAITWDEALYNTLGLFAFAGNRFGYPATRLLRVAYLAAPLIAASAVLGALARLLEERGALFGRRLRGHTVVGGLGSLGTMIARHEHRDRVRYVGIERADSVPGVESIRALGDGWVLIGDMTSPDLLTRARAHRARRVFLTAHSDVANLNAAFAVRRLVRERGSRRPPVVYAHVYDAGLADALQQQLRSSDPREADIVPFNIYGFAAKALIGTLLRDRIVGSLRLGAGKVLCRSEWPMGDAQLAEPPPGSPEALREDCRRLRAAVRLGGAAAPERLAIVGLGRFGRSVLRGLLDGCAATTKFLLVERDGQSTHAFVGALAPDEKARLEVFSGDASEREALSCIHDYKPTAALLCTDNDIGNLRLALDLQRRGVRAVVRMFDRETSDELGRGLYAHGIDIVGLEQLFRAAIPILTHERRVRACVNLDVAQTAEVDHIFYLCRVTGEERRALGEACVGLDELGADGGAPSDAALVWHRALHRLSPVPPEGDEAEAM
jgi:Trk K+ transport system NAD-binding subunit